MQVPVVPDLQSCDIAVSSSVDTFRDAIYAAARKVVVAIPILCGTAESTANRNRGATVRGHRKALKSTIREVTTTFDSRLSKAVKHTKAPLNSSRERLSRVLLSRVTPH
jgi:hypothetical protein